MTLATYAPEDLDALALRLFDVAAQIRSMAGRAREEQLDTVAIHDRKLLEIMGRMERWAHDAEVKMQMDLIRARGAKKAKAFDDEDAQEAP